MDWVFDRPNCHLKPFHVSVHDFWDYVMDWAFSWPNCPFKSLHATSRTILRTRLEVNLIALSSHFIRAFSRLNCPLKSLHVSTRATSLSPTFHKLKIQISFSMADNLDDGEFWLPPQFLTDDDTSFDNNNNNNKNLSKNDDVFDAVSRALFPYLSSASETESDEEEHLAELTRRVAHSTLELDLEKPKGVFGGGSPQSTLSAFGSSGKGSSPNGGVLHANSQSATRDLLRAAAGEVERMRLGEDRYGYGSLHNNAPKSSLVGLRFYSQQQHQPSLSHQQLQIAQFQMLRQQQMAKQQQRGMVPNRGRNNNVRGGSSNVGLSASAWPPLQHASGMRAVFLAGKTESTGTGVFFPRCVDTRNETRKEPACNTVLVPDRVAQALNLSLEGVVGGHLQHHHQQRFNGENGSAVPRVRSNNNNNNYYYGFSHPKRNNIRPPPQVNHEIQLPQEWTY
ncbi:myb protein K [Spatholobus suberectus]|nr:myb protein K [Spatholobus suberectus]